MRAWTNSSRVSPNASPSSAQRKSPEQADGGEPETSRASEHPARPDPEETAQALLDLAGERLSVEVALPSIAVPETYVDGSERVPRRAVFTVIAELQVETGEYRLRYSTRSSASGWQGARYHWSWSASSSRLRLIEVTVSKVVGADGVTRTERFDSRDLEGRVIEVVEARGWRRARRRGFWSRLLGRR
ncbi:MAG: hypothetical protein WCY76_11245 [Leucobacter sp.]